MSGVSFFIFFLLPGHNVDTKNHTHHQNPSALTKSVRQLKHSVTAAWAEDKQTKLLLLLSFSLLHYYFCLHSMQVFNWMPPFLAFLHPERSQVAISWSYSFIYSFNPELDQSSLAWLIHRDNKTACLALCLQSPARTDAPLDLPHIWQRTKNEWMNEWTLSVICYYQWYWSIWRHW